jgi:cellulose synthase/poly-beta-1,6-N-acetylglucosamine synthase-like glycosyltransferase
VLILLKYFVSHEERRSQHVTLPTLTVIIAAHNEENVIARKIENTLSLDYPRDKLEIIVSSDSSTDRTDEIVSSFATRDVKLFRHSDRKGKSQGLNVIVPTARGEIILFNDATTILAANTIRTIVSYFEDKSVGAVACKLTYNNIGETAVAKNEGLYFRYEEWLRKQESAIGALCTVSGACYAIRRNLFTQVPPGAPDDCVSPLEANIQGFRVEYEDTVKVIEELATEARGVMRIKKRGVARELNGIWHQRRILNIMKYPRQAFVIFSHRFMRYLCPFLMAGMLLFSVLIAIYEKNWLWYMLAALQIIFYGCAGIGSWRWANGMRLFSVANSFVIVNISAMLGVIDFSLNKDVSTWKSVRKKSQ